MQSIIATFNIWSLIVFLYFVFKNRLLSKIFKNRATYRYTPLSFFVALFSIYLNSILVSKYNQYLNMSYVKGAIVLPPFSLLFTISDFLASVIVILKIQKYLDILKKPLGSFMFDTTIMIFTFAVFSTVSSALWVRETGKLINWNYQCFKDQIAIDMAAYYYDQGELPQTIDNFTNFEKNPINDSPLVLKPGTTLTISVVDEEGSIILEGSDLMGMEMYSNDPESFFDRFRIKNNNLCKGKLKIP